MKADVWDKIELSIQAYGAPTTDPDGEQATAAEDDGEGSKRRRRRARRILDAIAWPLWVFAVVKVFVIDVDRIILERMFPDRIWLLDYRFFVYVAVIAVVVLRFRRSAAYLLYLAGFPLVVLLWKIPRLIFRHRSWLLAISLANAVTNIVSGLKYNFVTKSFAVLAGLGIVVSKNPWVVLPCAIYVLWMLLQAYYRALRTSLRGPAFIGRQREWIDKVLGYKWAQGLKESADRLTSHEVELYPKGQVDQFLMNLSIAVAINRGLYRWAYELTQYKRTPATLLFAVLNYLFLFIGTAIYLTLLNLALLNLAPTQYHVEGSITFLGVGLFAVSSLALNSAGGIEAAGNLAYALQLIAAVIGFVFLASLGVSLLLSGRKQREEEHMESTVHELKVRALQQDEQLRKEVAVSADEAMRRLERLGAGLGWLVASIASGIPEDFYLKDAE